MFPSCVIHINANYKEYSEKFKSIESYENKLLNKAQKIYKENKLELDEEIAFYDSFVETLIKNDSEAIIFKNIEIIKDFNRKMIEKDIEYLNKEKLKKILDLKKHRLIRNLESINKNNLETTTNLLREFQIETYYQIKSLHKYPDLDNVDFEEFNDDNQFEEYKIAFENWDEKEKILNTQHYNYKSGGY